MAIIDSPLHTAHLAPDALAFGTDPTPGIVSLDVRNDGAVTVWRRVEGRVLREQDSFEPWFLASSLDVLAPLGDRLVPLERDQPVPSEALAG